MNRNSAPNPTAINGSGDLVNAPNTDSEVFSKIAVDGAGVIETDAVGAAGFGTLVTDGLNTGGGGNGHDREYDVDPSGHRMPVDGPPIVMGGTGFTGDGNGRGAGNFNTGVDTCGVAAIARCCA